MTFMPRTNSHYSRPFIWPGQSYCTLIESLAVDAYPSNGEDSLT